jgi:hypothetical protein
MAESGFVAVTFGKREHEDKGVFNQRSREIGLWESVATAVASHACFRLGNTLSLNKTCLEV